MTRNLRTEAAFEVPAKVMQDILGSEQLVAERHRLSGAITANVRELRRTESALVQEVTTSEHSRHRRGVDQTKRESATTVYTWNLPAKTCTWIYRGSRGSLVQIEGAIRIQPQGDDACRVISTVRINVPVPLIGRAIEARIARDIEAGFEPFERLLSQRCNAWPRSGPDT